MNFKKNKIRYPKTGCTYNLSIPPKTKEIDMGINKTGVSSIKDGRKTLAKVFYRPEYHKGTSVSYSKYYCIEITVLGSKEFDSLEEAIQQANKELAFQNLPTIGLNEKVLVMADIYSPELLLKKLKEVGNPLVDSLKAKEDAAELLGVSVGRLDEVFNKGEFQKHPKFIASLIVAIKMQG
jgi:ASC-1-like (ASCH) protein